MSRESTSLLRSALTGVCLLLAACGGPAKKSEPSPFQPAAEPARDRDWPLDTEDDGGFIGDPEDDAGDEDDDEYAEDEDFDSYDDGEDEEMDDSLLEDEDLVEDDFEDEDFEDDE